MTILISETLVPYSAMKVQVVTGLDSRLATSSNVAVRFIPQGRGTISDFRKELLLGKKLLL